MQVRGLRHARFLGEISESGIVALPNLCSSAIVEPSTVAHAQVFHAWVHVSDPYPAGYARKHACQHANDAWMHATDAQMHAKNLDIKRLASERFLAWLHYATIFYLDVKIFDIEGLSSNPGSLPT